MKVPNEKRKEKGKKYPSKNEGSSCFSQVCTEMHSSSPPQYRY
jgi:hypothetical protein